MELAIILRTISAVGLALWFTVWSYRRGWWDWALLNKWKRRKKKVERNMTAKKSIKRPSDLNKRAASTVALATGQIEETKGEATEVAEPSEEERHVAAVTLGRKGGRARAMKLSAEKRSEIAKKAAQKRWSGRDTA